MKLDYISSLLPQTGCLGKNLWVQIFGPKVDRVGFLAFFRFFEFYCRTFVVEKKNLQAHILGPKLTEAAFLGFFGFLEFNCRTLLVEEHRHRANQATSFTFFVILLR